jgi:hypothetical protein
MKKTYLLLIFTLILISCKKDLYTYTYFDKSELTITSGQDSYMKYGSIESGENLVFEYRFVANDDKEIADDEYSETVRFEIDSKLDKFSYSDDELLNIKAVFTKNCYCDFSLTESKIVNPKGTISGEKISNNEWEIKINITFYGDEEKVINGNFKLK